MLTYRTISFMDKKPLYWLSIATHYAKSADAHRYHEKQDTREGGLLKRLWWCCVLRDRILALALRQSPLLSPTAYNCPELSVADFAHEIGTSRVYDGIVKRLIVQIAIALGDLGTLLSEIPPAPSLAKNTDGDTQRDLDAHLDVMNQFNRLYDNATSTIKYIQGIVEHLKISVPLPTYTASSHVADEHAVRPATLIEESLSSDTWADMLLKNPRMYLRIAFAVEFSLARGRCPAEEDFPQWLRDHRRHEDEPYSHSSSTRGNSRLNSVFFSEAMEDFADEDREVL
ncbi:hypothetical protein FocnCong_v017427 [Fusarium oxysporum f. sp. conglutinans]|nr:hypothetical protein FocnCong_v017427 [Fusarium oxysporum f. sp. conglutinans]